MQFDIFEDYIIYRRAYLTDADANKTLNFGENVVLVTNDNIRVQAYFLKQRGTLFNKSHTIVCFLGNSSTLSQRIELAKNFFNYCTTNVLLVEHRGYGVSTGTPTENGFYLDAKSAIEFLLSRNDLDKNKILLFGEGIGGAVAINTGRLGIILFFIKYKVFCY